MNLQTFDERKFSTEIGSLPLQRTLAPPSPLDTRKCVASSRLFALSARGKLMMLDTARQVSSAVISGSDHLHVDINERASLAADNR